MTEVAFRAPGRVNLIGEHVDYAGGWVLPAAIDKGVTLRGVVTAGRAVRIESRELSGTAVVDTRDPTLPQSGWARYVAAVVTELNLLGVPVTGFEGVVTSDLPVGAGLSSSAALEVCVAGALATVAGVRLVGIELALLAWRAEHRAVGVPCGIMDQAASALGTLDHALLLDCASLEHRPVPLPADTALLILDSAVRRRLEHSEYAQRRAEVARALALLPAEATREWEPERALDHARRAGLDDVAYRRLRHVVTERLRVEAVVESLERPSADGEERLRRAFAEGHASLRDDFEVSVPELDLLVELAIDEGALAARMTGGGFGGSVVALAPIADAHDVGERIVARYAASTGLNGAALVTRAAAGAGHVLHSDGQPHGTELNRTLPRRGQSFPIGEGNVGRDRP